MSELSELRKQWRAARLEYPGWVVTPDDNREQLWIHTRFWVHAISKSLDELPAPENLLLLYELNWRLERALWPLFLDGVQQMTTILETFAVLPRVFDLPSALYRPTMPKFQDWDWKELGFCWLELAFAVTREAREDLDSARHQMWLGRLQSFAALSPVTAARIHHEKALFRLWELDFRGLRETLSGWPALPEQPFWEAKRAALLAEAGKLDEAIAVSEQALDTVRSRQTSGQDDIALLSQEGWIINLVKICRRGKQPSLDEDHEAFRERYAQLEAFRCNPWSILEPLDLRLRHDAPQIIPAAEEILGFDPNRVSVRRHSSPGLSVEEHQAAFGMLRLFEEAAMPMHVGIVANSTKASANAAVRIEPNAPFWAFTTMVRADQPEVLLTKYNRVRIATLPPDQVVRLFELLTRAMKNAIDSIVQHEQAFSLSNERRVFPTIVELLSRLTIRLSPEQLQTVFGLAVIFYQIPLGLMSSNERKEVGPLFERLLGQAMSREQALDNLGTLLALPLPGEAGLVGQNPVEMWPEPVYFIREPDEDTKFSSVDPAPWKPSIDHLLAAVAAGEKAARGNAAIRLMILYRQNLLSQEQSAAFANALWGRLDPSTGLPTDTVFRNMAFLSLPERQSGEAQTAFRKYVADTPFPRSHVRTLSPDGKTWMTTLPMFDRNRLAADIEQATMPPRPRGNVQNRLIVWTREEGESLLRKARTWWDDEQSDLNDPRNQSDALIPTADTTRSQLADLVDLLNLAVLPAVRESEQIVRDSAAALVSDMARAGFAVQTALPRLLLIKPELRDEAVDTLRAGLVSTDAEVSRGSILGLFFWLLDADALGAPAPPPDLLQEWVNKITARREPALTTALGQMSQLIACLPDALTTEQRESLCIGLRYLAKETALPTWTEQLGVRGDDSREGLRVQERPAYRHCAAELAATLADNYLAAKRPLPVVIEEWRELARTDPLPEVRRAFPSAK